MYNIKIKNGKATKTSWSTEIREYVTKDIDSLVPYLDCPIEIEDTTFAQFFAFIEKDLDLYNTIYRSATYGFPIGPYVDELKKPGKPCDLDYLEVYWGSDTDDGILSDYPCFHGWGTWESPPGFAPGETPPKGGWAMEFTPLCDYKDYLLKLNNDYRIYDEKLNEVFRTKKGFRVHDVIKGILFEITWSGDISKGRSSPLDDCESCQDLKS